MSETKVSNEAEFYAIVDNAYFEPETVEITAAHSEMAHTLYLMFETVYAADEDVIRNACDITADCFSEDFGIPDALSEALVGYHVRQRLGRIASADQA
jgi:hypothetical protein